MVSDSYCARHLKLLERLAIDVAIALLCASSYSCCDCFNGCALVQRLAAAGSNSANLFWMITQHYGVLREMAYMSVWIGMSLVVTVINMSWARFQSQRFLVFVFVFSKRTSENDELGI